MSRLEELIAALCPDGVRSEPLKNICEIRSGWGFPNSEQGLAAGDIPFYKVSDMNNIENDTVMTVSKNYISKDTAKKLGCSPAPAGTVIFPKIGAAIGTNKKRILSTLSCYDNNIVGLIPNDGILSKFLYYTISMINIIQFADYSGAMPSIRKSTLEKYKIPVPPLPVQEEIVRILDTFSELIAELTAELTKRNQQYRYYHDITIKTARNINMMKISQICLSVADGDHQAPPKVSKGIPFITISNINSHNTIDFSNIKYVPTDYYEKLDIKRKPAKGDVLYTVVGSYGIPVYIDFNKNFSFQRHIAILRPNKNILIPKYLFYVLKSTEIFNKANILATGAAQKTITLSSLSNMKVPVPSLEEQERIVSILDRFDALCNDPTSGLPAEIEARKRQYEYYRDKLLTFKESV